MKIVVKIRMREPAQDPNFPHCLPIGREIFYGEAFDFYHGEGVQFEEHTLLIDSDFLETAPSERVEDDDLQRLHKRLMHYFKSHASRLSVDLEYLNPEEGARALAEIAKRRDAVTENSRFVREAFFDGWRN